MDEILRRRGLGALRVGFGFRGGALGDRSPLFPSPLFPSALFPSALFPSALGRAIRDAL